MKTLLLIGGPMDGERYTIEDDCREFEIVERVETPRATIALASQPSQPRHLYRVHRLYEQDTIYEVAVHAEAERPVIEMLIDGYGRAR